MLDDVGNLPKHVLVRRIRQRQVAEGGDALRAGDQGPDGNQGEVQPFDRVGHEARRRVELERGDWALAAGIVGLVVELDHHLSGGDLAADDMVVGQEQAGRHQEPATLRPARTKDHPAHRVGGKPAARQELHTDEVDGGTLQSFGAVKAARS